jgi:hypothetical protein
VSPVKALWLRNEIMEDYNIQRSVRQRFQSLGAETDGLARQVRIMSLGSTQFVKLKIE